MWDKPRIAYCRFLNRKPLFNKHCKKNKYNRVVTVAWNYDRENNILSYGATVYKKALVKNDNWKANRNDNWAKKPHRETAIQRYTNNPVRINFPLCYYVGKSNGYGYSDYESLDKRAVDWFIARNLISKLGCSTGEVETVHDIFVCDNFNKKYFPDFSDNTDSLRHNCLNNPDYYPYGYGRLVYNEDEEESFNPFIWSAALISLAGLICRFIFKG